jgi:hypothetical protein
MSFLSGTCVLSQVKKYDIKSGVITYDHVNIMGGFETTSKIVVWFDDYGMKECRETYENDKPTEATFNDGKEMYKIKYPDKAAFRMGAAYRGTEFRFAWDEVSDRDKNKGIAKLIPNMTIAGKHCEAFEISQRGTITRYAGWSHILFCMEMKTEGMTDTQKAVKIEENKVVPADKFKIPAGFTVQ